MKPDLFRRLQESHLVLYHVRNCMIVDCKECKDIQDFRINKDEEDE